MSRSTKPRIRRSQGEITRLRNLLATHLEAGGEVKAFAMDHQLQLQWVYRSARALGYHAVYIRDIDRKFLLECKRQRHAA